MLINKSKDTENGAYRSITGKGSKKIINFLLYSFEKKSTFCILPKNIFLNKKILKSLLIPLEVIACRHKTTIFGFAWL